MHDSFQTLQVLTWHGNRNCRKLGIGAFTCGVSLGIAPCNLDRSATSRFAV